MGWSHRGVVMAAICIYLATLAANPAAARASAGASLREIERLAVPIVVAMFLGGLMKNLLTRERISRLLGTSEPKEVLAAAVMGSVLPPCPFVAYPLIKSFSRAGMRFPALIAMLITSTVVEVPQVFAGVAILGMAIEGARILFAFMASLIVGYSFLLLARRRLPPHARPLAASLPIAR
jgi:uncharacterized membrane protein YraQ (UPF0718 family)